MYSYKRGNGGCCAVCGRTTAPLERHHVYFGVGNRRLSEEYNMVVLLCPEHHRGNTGVHRNRELDLKLKRQYQEVFEDEHPELDFRTVFGKSYL